MYFSLVPDIEYKEKPIGFPFTESDIVTAKNFFRRFQISEDVLSYAVYFKEYTIKDGDRPDTIADRAYGNPFYDWVILLTNNMVNAQYDWPMTNFELSSVLELEYDDPYSEIHHYETTEIKNSDGNLVLKGGLTVDETFYNGQFKYNNGSNYVIKNGNEVSSPVTVADHYTKENEKKRQIYILKPAYFKQFVDDFRKKNLYKKDANYISQRLKKSG